MSYIPPVAWDIEFTDTFGEWWESLMPEEQDSVAMVVDLLEEYGPTLRRPYSDVVAMSKHQNMKELRIQHAGRPYRVLYAFDPRRTAVLLIGGDKTGTTAGTRNSCHRRTNFSMRIWLNREERRIETFRSWDGTGPRAVKWSREEFDGKKIKNSWTKCRPSDGLPLKKARTNSEAKWRSTS